ncbi:MULTISPECIES: FAD-binding protein [Clostridium]|uniref:FAD-binding protein n=1 Tax=Clostridium TaxID=1485 RepID=UPI00082616CB|nr:MULTISPECIES: FAD-binding protein [Clostridium]PJI07240.1 FAD-binding protein [Clostridium sp. CT7]
MVLKLLKGLNPTAASNITSFPLTPGVTGDEIKVVKEIGALMDPIPTVMIFDRGAVKPGKEAGEPFEGKMFWLGSQPFLKVNKFGERYTNESVPYDFCVHAASMQPGKVWCSIFDSNWMEDVLKFHTIGCSRVVLPKDNEKHPCNFNTKIIEVMNEKLLKDGYMQQANTIEELAQKLMLPPETLKATITHYNELCEKGEDKDFRKAAFRMRPIAKVPFYGITVGGNLLCTLDGLRINTNMQILDKNMEPIKGLFAVGNDSGGFFAYSYPELTPGVAAGRSMTFGRHVGKYLANL